MSKKGGVQEKNAVFLKIVENLWGSIDVIIIFLSFSI
jgi:hypothetical protein